MSEVREGENLPRVELKAVALVFHDWASVVGCCWGAESVAPLWWLQ